MVQETGMYYLQSRYYDPEICRFINADAATFIGANSTFTSYNLFSYCLNNPVNNTDDGGTLSLPNWAKVAIGVGIIAAAAAVTVATGGAAAGTLVAAVNCVAHGALVGAVTQGAIGAVSGAASGAISHRITTGSWEGAGQAAVDGAATGFMTGTITGAITGGMNSPYCFVAGTTVLTAAGAAAIETIQAGDMVWAWDEETGEVALKEVVETYVNETDELIHIFVNGEEIVTTPSHPFYSPIKGWTDAVRLRAGDILVLVNGEYVVVEKVQHEILEAPITVYNFQVEDYHTYYVTESTILVHNACRNPFGKAGGPEHQELIKRIGDSLSDQGYTVTYEYRVKVNGGYKNTRYADIFASNDVESFAVQVGRANNNGLPVSREAKAIVDLENSGIDTFFVPYRIGR